MVKKTTQQELDELRASLQAEMFGKMEEIERRHTRNPRNDWSRMWQALSVIMSVAAIIFTIGYNWSKVATLESRMTAVEVAIQQMIKQQSDQKVDSALLLQQVNNISATVNEIKGAQTQRGQNPR